MSRLATVLLLSLIGFTFAAQAAPPEGKGNAHQAAKASTSAVGFRAKDLEIVRAYYAKNPHALPPGLAKKGKVPPGHAKKGKIAPAIGQGTLVTAEMKKAFHPLPPALETQLPPPSKGYVHVIFGNDVLMVEVKTNRVFDVLKDVLQ